MADVNDRDRPQPQQPYSGLEVVQNDYPEAYWPPGHNDLYAHQPGADDQYKYLVPSADRNGQYLEHAVDHAGYRPAPEKANHDNQHPTTTELAESPAPPRRSRKKKIIALAVITVVVIVGAVVGGVVGSRAAKSQAPDGEASSSSDAEALAAAASMTGAGSPTSVAPGLAPTAISWGYPHLEVYALTKNTSNSVYRKWRNVNTTSENSFEPAGAVMQLVGGAIDTDKAPSIGASRRLYRDDSGTMHNRTEIHVYSFVGPAGYRKYHDDDQLWSPYDGDSPGSPTLWDPFKEMRFLSAPTMVSYDRAVQMVKTFVLGAGDKGAAVHYFQWDPPTGWTGPVRIDGPGLHTWAAPAVVAWGGDDTRLDVFAVSRANNHLLYAYKEAETDKWTEYEDLKGFVTTPPVAVARAPGHLDVFARGGDGGLWHLTLQNATNKAGGAGRWAAWQRISGATMIQGQPDAVAAGPDRIEVFAWAAEGGMLHKTYDGATGKWLPDKDGFNTLVQSGLAGPPKAATDGTDTIHVFAYNDRDEMLWQKIGPDSKPMGEASAIANVPYLS